MIDLGACPTCRSELVQPHGWRPGRGSSDQARINLSCPECETCTVVGCDATDIARLDRLQSARRTLLVASYERLVADSMEALLGVFVEALALDLISADDFASAARRAEPARRPCPAPQTPDRAL